MHVRAETFVQGEPQKMCLTTAADVITFYVNGRAIASQAPVGSVALLGGGKVQYTVSLMYLQALESYFLYPISAVSQLTKDRAWLLI